MVNIWRDHISPPKPELTEKNLADQAGKASIRAGIADAS